MKIRFDTTLERDIDLLIMGEFVSNEDFANIFLKAANVRGAYKIEEVIHSKTDAELGESDIVLVLNINNKNHAIHIEDKIDAIAMPEQHDRYDKRAKKDIENGEYDSYSVIIVAPEKYLAKNEESKKYANKVTYEEMLRCFLSKGDLRSKYKIALIEKAIDDQKSGYQWKANPGVVNFCTAMNEYKRVNYPKIPDGTIAWWPGYKTFIEGATIVFKANKGFVDLEFRNTTTAELYARIGDLMSSGMQIEKAGKSASVRIKVSPIDFEESFETKLSEADEALHAIEKMFELSIALLKRDGE